MLLIKQTVKKVMITDALQSFPDECCGFFFGEETGEDRMISEAMPVTNTKDGDKRRRFEISPIDYLKAEQYADEHQLQLLGVYHSHPNHPAIPSEEDRIAAQHYFSYSIISILHNEFADLRSWRLNDQRQFTEEEVLVHI